MSAWSAFLMPFLPFVYGYLSSSPCAHCTPNKSMPTLHYSRRPGPIYTGHACRHLLNTVPWISEDRLLFHMHNNGVNFWDETECIIIWPSPTKHMLKMYYIWRHRLINFMKTTVFALHLLSTLPTFWFLSHTVWLHTQVIGRHVNWKEPQYSIDTTPV